jgi:hypothetical protein
LIPVLALVLALQLAPGDPVTTAPPPAPPPATAAPAPASPAPAGPAPAPGPPRRIDDLSRPLTGAVPQGSYEERLRGASSRTQSLQGPLDGTWMLKTAAGAALYRVQLVDPGFSGGRLEGAWSDLSAAAAPDASGFFSGVVREGGRLTLQFARPGTGLMVAALEQRPQGGYAGELRSSEAGRPDRSEPVILVRP